MNPTSKDIATYLSNQSSLGLTLAEDLFFSKLPDQPDNCVAVMDNGGEPALLFSKKQSNNYHYSSVTVYSRNTNYEDGWAVINDIVEELHGVGNVTIDGTFYSVIKSQGDPQILVYDDNNRVILIVNFEVQRRNP